MSSRQLSKGVFVPILTFFKTNDYPGGIDTELTAKHVVRLAKAGIKGVLTCGSYGEGTLTSAAERIELIKCIRKAWDDNGFTDRLIYHGISDNSYLTAIQNSIDAKEAGADAVLATPPGYYAAGWNEAYLVDYYTKLAENSPLPVILYSYPAVSAGIDLSSDLIIKLNQHPNIVGAKFTCANLGKLTRIVNSDPSFLAYSGMSDFMIASLAVGGSGTIAGPANIIPHTVIQAYDAFQKGDISKAFELQKQLADFDNDLMRLGIEGTKLVLSRYYGGSFATEQVRSPPGNLTKEKINEFVELADKYFKLDDELAAAQ